MHGCSARRRTNTLLLSINSMRYDFRSSCKCTFKEIIYYIIILNISSAFQAIWYLHFIFLLLISFTVYFLFNFFLQCLTVFLFYKFLYCISPSSSSLAHFQHVHLFYKSHDCPFHENQELWHGRAPVFKSCLASGRQSPLGCLPPLSAVVERAIWTRERSVFPISRWFPLPCTPPTPALKPGLHCCLWDCCRLAACHWTPHSLTNNNVATKGVIEKVPYWCIQTSRSCSCQNKSSVPTHETDRKR